MFSRFVLTFLIYISILFIVTTGKDDDCKCGIVNPNSNYIIRGSVSQPYTYPWVVYLETRDWRRPLVAETCTASIISPNYILTAAHCVPENLNPSGVTVYTYQGCNRNWKLYRGPHYAIKRVIRHAKYDGVTDGNDIAMLELKTPIADAMPICLPHKSVKRFADLMSIGWGMIDVNGLEKHSTDCLMEAEMDQVNWWSCRLNFPTANHDHIMCAGGSSSICQGDSGGPLMSRNSSNGLMFQAGIASFVRSDCGIATKSPGGFEKVIPHLQWIKDNSDGLCFK